MPLLETAVSKCFQHSCLKIRATVVLAFPVFWGFACILLRGMTCSAAWVVRGTSIIRLYAGTCVARVLVSRDKKQTSNF